MKVLFSAFLVAILMFSGTIALAGPVITEKREPKYLQNIRDIINSVEPRGEAFWNWESNEWSPAVSASVLPIYGYADLKIGLSVDKTPYFGIDTDLFTVGEVLLPAKLKELLSGVPQVIQIMARDYARVGVVGGYSWDENDAVYGPTFGASLKW